MGVPHPAPPDLGLPCWLQELKEETDSPRGSWGLVQAQVAAGTARGKGPLLDSAKQGLGLRKTWFRTLTHPPPPPPRASWA